MLQLLTLSLACLQATPVSSAPDVSTPVRRSQNIVLILADDFGVDMVGAYGEGSAPPCTPTIDGLAQDGMLFRNAWANPACTPTRAALMTGRHGFRTGLGQPGAGAFLEFAETTIPEVLRGYTSSCTGKWHLATGQNNQTHPNLSGFDHYSGALSGGVPDYFNWAKVTNGTTSTSTTYATTDTIDDAIAAMVGMPEPWFLYVSLNAPHTPYHTPPASICQPSGCPTPLCGNLPSNPTELMQGKAMVEAMDEAVGDVLDALDASGQAENTIVVFFSDNGGLSTSEGHPTSNLPLRGGKGWLYEGGIRVPCIVNWPGQGRSGSVVDEPIISTDFYPTILEMAGLPARPGQHQDGVSLAPLVAGNETFNREAIYWHFPHYSNHGMQSPGGAIRQGDYKLLEYFENDTVQLFDLKNDIGEQRDLAQTCPAKVAELRAKFCLLYTSPSPRD